MKKKVHPHFPYAKALFLAATKKSSEKRMFQFDLLRRLAVYELEKEHSSHILTLRQATPQVSLLRM